MTNINPIFLFFPISLAALPFSLLFFKKRRLSLALSSFFFVCGLLFLIWGASFPIGGIEGKYMMVSLYLSAPLLLSCLLFFSLNIFRSEERRVGKECVP